MNVLRTDAHPLTQLVDLAAERLGGSVLHATDDFFASKDNLLKEHAPVFIEGKYTDRGKWMDGWESRRRREHAYECPLSTHAPRPLFDSAIVRLGLPGIVRAFVVDTSFFTGNYPSECAVEGVSLDGHPSLESLLCDTLVWTPLLSRDQASLKGGSRNVFEVHSEERFTHLRFHIFPDGGVARLRVHGEVMPSAGWLGHRSRPQLVDLAAAEYGAHVVACNDMFFGSRHNLIMPGRGVNMGDGWETKRGRREGPDWVVLRLAAAGHVERAVLDTLHFKGNAPDFASLDVARVAPGDPCPDGVSDASCWVPLLPKERLQPHTLHTFEDELARSPGAKVDATHVRMRIWPDGGVSRLRLFGVGSDLGRERVGMAYLRAMSNVDLAAALKACCGSEAWVTAMSDERRRSPMSFARLAALTTRAGELWDALDTAAWDQAFRAHPRIGETQAEAHQSALARSWSESEQRNVSGAEHAARDELREVNEAYEAKFGRLYIVCATGKTVAEMVAMATARMAHDPATEWAVAAAEQRLITALRLQKLVLR